MAARPHSIDLAERGGFVRSFASTASLQVLSKHPPATSKEPETCSAAPK